MQPLLQPYRSFRPTVSDSAGLNADALDRGDWLRVPVSRTRDSGSLDRSNFATALARLGGESDTVEVLRFGHWGPGWFEIILIDPTDPARMAEGEQIARDLLDYPILDETDYSERQWQTAADYWARCSIRERVQYLHEAGGNVFAARRAELPDDYADPAGKVYERLTADD